MRALQGRAIEGVANCASALDERLYDLRLAFSRQASTTRWTAAAPPSRCVRSRRDTDLYRADVVKLEMISYAKVCGGCRHRSPDGGSRIRRARWLISR